MNEDFCWYFNNGEYIPRKDLTVDIRCWGGGKKNAVIAGDCNWTIPFIEDDEEYDNIPGDLVAYWRPSRQRE